MAWKSYFSTIHRIYFLLSSWIDILCTAQQRENNWETKHKTFFECDPFRALRFGVGEAVYARLDQDWVAAIVVENDDDDSVYKLQVGQEMYYASSDTDNLVQHSLPDNNKPTRNIAPAEWQQIHRDQLVDELDDLSGLEPDDILLSLLLLVGAVSAAEWLGTDKSKKGYRMLWKEDHSKYEDTLRPSKYADSLQRHREFSETRFSWSGSATRDPKHAGSERMHMVGSNQRWLCLCCSPCATRDPMVFDDDWLCRYCDDY